MPTFKDLFKLCGILSDKFNQLAVEHREVKGIIGRHIAFILKEE